MKILALAAFAATIISSPLQAQTTPDVTVTNAWIRATVPQQKATGAFMQLRSGSGAHVVEVKTSAAAIAEIHEMKMDGDVMRMRPMPSLALPAGKTVELSPGGYHLMLMQLTRQLNAGDKVPLSLVVENADGKRSNVDVEVAVRPLNSSAMPPGEHKH
jgi:copper(I)-binding protein